MQLKVVKYGVPYFLAMKFLFILTIVFCFQAQGRGYSQEIALSFKEAPMESVFKNISEQTGYSFIYTRSQLKKTNPITIHAKGTLISLLDQCFKGQPIGYILEDRYIVIVDNETPKPYQNGKPSPIVIKGRIINESGDPVPGASIKVKGTGIGTYTDSNGGFELVVPSLNIILVITSVNTEPFEYPVKGNPDIKSISVKTQITSLDAVVINKGYYSTTQQLNTGSVERVSSKEISKQPLSNPISALQGKVPGLLISQKNGLPGSNLNIQIRGQNSIQQGNEPLFIIDGVPFSSENFVRLGINLNASNPFNSINPEDIETIEILKDADATSIYGSRGANGVVLITTKKGRPGKINANISVSTGWSRATRTMAYLNTRQYLAMRNEAFANDQIQPDEFNAPDLFLWDTLRYNNWKNKILDGTSYTRNIQTRIQGGTSELNYTLNVGNLNEGSVLPGNFKYERSTVSFSLNHSSFNRKFNAVLSANFTNEKNNLSSQDITSFINLPPNMYNPYDSLGKLIWDEKGFSYGNPFSMLKQGYKSVSNRLISNLNLNYQILKNLNFRTNFNANIVNFDQSSTRPLASQNPAYNPRGSANFYNTKSSILNIEPQFDYSLGIEKKGMLSFTAGSTFQEKLDNGIFLSGTGYTNDALINSIVGAGTVTVQNDYALYRYSSIFGRANFNWAGKYILNGVARIDASSRFGPGNRTGKFGAIGMAYVFSKEKLLESNLKFLSFGKLRGSVGVTGNDKIGDYQYFDTWISTLNSYQNQTGLRPLRLFNENYGWEEIRKMNVGIDLGFFKDRINLVADYYQHRSSNQLVFYNLPDQSGFNSIIRNIPGVIENKGLEFSLNSLNMKSPKFSWRSSFNITFQKNRLVEFQNLENSSYSDRYIIGKPLNILIGYNYLGVSPSEGIYKFDDVNKDGILNTDDYMYQGTTDPKFYGGLGNIIQYGDVEFSFLFEFRKQVGRHAILGYSTLPGTMINQPVEVLNRWKKPGDIAEYQMFTQSFGTPASEAADLTPISGAAITDASFIRLKNVALYYNVSKRFVEFMKMSSVRLFIQGQNLLTITRYIGADPENQNPQALPPLKTMVIGLNVNF